MRILYKMFIFLIIIMCVNIPTVQALNTNDEFKNLNYADEWPSAFRTAYTKFESYKHDPNGKMYEACFKYIFNNWKNLGKGELSNEHDKLKSVYNKVKSYTTPVDTRTMADTAYAIMYCIDYDLLNKDTDPESVMPNFAQANARNIPAPENSGTNSKDNSDKKQKVDEPNFNWPSEFMSAYNTHLKYNEKLIGTDWGTEYEDMRVKIYKEIFKKYQKFTEAELDNKLKTLNKVLKEYNAGRNTGNMVDTLFGEIATNLKSNIVNGEITKDADPNDTIADASSSKYNSLNEKGEEKKDSVGILPERKLGLITDQKEETVKETAPDTIIESADEFLNVGQEDEIDEASLQNVSNTVYNILLAVAIVLAVIMGLILGIKFMASGIEGQAKVKEALIPYIAGCTVAFSAFGIWKLIITILNSV